jgi:heat shock protein HslJ
VSPADDKKHSVIPRFRLHRYGRELAVMRLDMNLSRALSTLIVASLASLAIACTESSSLPTSPSAGSSGSSALTSDQLAGTWTLVSIQSAGQAERTVPSGASYVLTIADGRLSTRADCNMCSGAFKLSGQTLTAGPALACTRAACPTMEFESAYTALLSGESTVTLSGNTLVLSSVRGVLRFSRA